MKESIIVRSICLLTFLFIVYVSKSQNEIVTEGTIKLNGQVVSNEGQNVEGLKVQEFRKENYTTTDKDGHFQLKIEKGSKVEVDIGEESSLKFKAKLTENLKIDISEGEIIYCCTKHPYEDHCGRSMRERKKLIEENGCVFK